MPKFSSLLIAAPAILVALPAFAECGRHGVKCRDARHPQVKTQFVEPATYEVTETNGLAIGLPAGAAVGECFARMAVPASWETATDQVTLREASERIEIVPAVYETITEQVLVRPESTDVIDVPPEFQRVTEEVLVQPARSEWQYVSCGPVATKRSPCGPRARVSANRSDERLCLVEIPARYETIVRNEMVRPPSTRTVTHAAEYRTISRQVVKTPARQVAVAIPAEYGTVTRQVLVSDGGSEWQRVDCRSSQLTSYGNVVVPPAASASSYRRVSYRR